METRFTRIARRTLLIFIGSIAVACSLDQRPSDPATEQPSTERLERSPNVKEIELPDGGRGRIKAEGWPTPDLGTAEKADEFKVQGAKTIDGVEVDVEAVRYRPEYGKMLLSPDMAAEMGESHLNVQGVSEYTAKNRTFAYMYLVNPVELDERTNRIKNSQRYVFYFALYDEDGDGKFETLAIAEPSVTRRLRPHVPTWAAK